MLTRREALVKAAGLTAAFGLCVVSPRAAGAAVPFRTAQTLRGAAQLPAPDQSGIEHIVLVMLENRSFDHLLGWLPGHDGRQAGLVYTDTDGVAHATYPLAPDYQGCGLTDPDHSFDGGRIEYNNGACDGWLRAGANDLFCIGYYLQPDLPFLGQIAPRFVTLDSYFAAILAPTFPNRIYQHAAQTDRLRNTSATCALPTIWDRLSDAGITGGYYSSDLSILSLWGNTYTSISSPVDKFFADAAAGTLPAVSFVDPAFFGEADGSSNDDHPFNDVRQGEVFLDSLYRAVTSGPGWSKTVMIINFDEWGGFFDHVPPPAGPVTDAEVALGYGDGLRGFRVPCVIISPWSQFSQLPQDRAVFDHTSVLKLIEWRFGLQPLTARDAQANNLAQLLDFSSPRLDVPATHVPPGPFAACAAAASS